MWWKKKTRTSSVSEKSSRQADFAANSSKSKESRVKSHNSRSSIIPAVISIFGVLLIIILLIIGLFSTLLSANLKKSILLVNQTIDGNIDDFMLASFDINANNTKLALVSVKDKIELLPSSFVLDDTKTQKQQLIQASLQTGILIDEIWQVELEEVSNKEDAKQFFLQSWKAHESNTFPLDLWKAWFLLSKNNITISSVDAVASLSDYDLSPAGAEIARQCSIAVVNTTSKSGVANFLTNYLEKKGVVVVRITDNNANLDTSRVVLAEESEACAAVVNTLQYLQPEKTSVSINREVANRYRASAILFLGKDITELQEIW